MVRNVVVLGSTGALGSSVVSKLAECSGFNVIPVVRDTVHGRDGCFWNFLAPLPLDIANADVVINCARSRSFSENIRISKLLCEGLSQRTLFVNLSSNCVLARPRSLLPKLLYQGDAYVREKRIIEKLTSMRPNSIVVRPSIVPDEGGWLNFLDICRNAKVILSPFDMECSRVDVSSREFVGDEIVRNIRESTVPILLELSEKRISVKEFIEARDVRSASRNTYFNSFFKNLLTMVLCSKFLPDHLVFLMQSRIQAKGSVVDSSIQTEFFSIEGMSRLYLFGGHTLNGSD